MKTSITKLHKVKTLLRIALLTMTVGLGFTPANADSLYIGDGGDNSVKQFDAATGVFQGNFVPPASGKSGLYGPRGLIFTKGQMFLINQNVGKSYGGEVFHYDASTGEFLGALVPCEPPLKTCDPNAPFAPRGMIRGSNSTLSVADVGDFSTHPGKVIQYDLDTGKFLSNFNTKGFSAAFFPRGIVRGPDGLVYVSVVGNLAAGDTSSGYVLRFNPQTGKFVNVFANHAGAGCSVHLHRPEGLVFGSDGRLYVTAFRKDANDNDKILVFNSNGSCVDQINLDEVGQPRAYAQALLFGPNGQLFVPINNTGEVRRYNVTAKTYDVFIPSGILLNPWYLSFGSTNPRTLEY